MAIHESAALAGEKVAQRDEELNAFAVAVAQFDAAADLLQLNDDTRAILRAPKRELTVNFPVRMDSGKVKMFIHAFLSQPISGAIVTTVTFKKIHHGRFGLLAAAKIPQITGGSGSITSFNLNISKWFRYKGHKTRAFSAQCADGKLKVHVLAKFEDGTKAETEIVRACRPKG